jgi:hypothetical protein
VFAYAGTQCIFHTSPCFAYPRQGPSMHKRRFPNLTPKHSAYYMLSKVAAPAPRAHYPSFHIRDGTRVLACSISILLKLGELAAHADEESDSPGFLILLTLFQIRFWPAQVCLCPCVACVCRMCVCVCVFARATCLLECSLARFSRTFNTEVVITFR